MHEVVYAYDMRMRQFEAPLCLVPELVKRHTILNHEIGKKFQRDIALQFFIARQPDNSHSAPAEHLDQLVAAKDLLSAGELTRRRRCDTARPLVSHLDSLSVIKIEGKNKAGVAERPRICSGSLFLCMRHFAPSMTFS
jgi:hypothetical protein